MGKHAKGTFYPKEKWKKLHVKMTEMHKLKYCHA